MPFARTRGFSAWHHPTRSVATIVAMASACVVGTVRADEAPAYQTVVVDEREAHQARDDRAASASVITADRTPRAGEDLPQLLSELPGVDIVRYGGPGAFSTISLRGSTPNQVQVYIDDVPLNVATGGGVDLGFLPLAQIDRIEVYRGSSPIQFGASGIGGVLSLRTQVPVGSTAAVQSSVGSFGTRSIGGRASHDAGRVRLLAGGQTYSWLGNFPYINDSGTAFMPGNNHRDFRKNNDLSQVDANVKLEVPWATRTLSASALLNQREQGTPGNGLYQVKHARFRTQRLQAQLALESRGDMGIGSRLHANVYAVATDQALSDPYHEIFPGGAQTDDRFRTYGAALRTHWLLGSTRLRTIGEVTRQDYLPYDATARDPAGAPGGRTSLALGAEADLWARWLRLSVLPSFRMEMARDTVSQRQRFTDKPEALEPAFHLLPVARLAFVQEATQALKLHGNVGRYVRLPATTELYGNTGFVLPNPALRPESGWNADLGMRLEMQRENYAAAVDAAAFANFADNLIQYVQAAGLSRAENISRARTMGLEVAVKSRIARVVHVSGQFTRLDGRNLSEAREHNGRLLPLRWPWRFFFRPELRDLPVSSKLRAGVYSDVNFATGAYADKNNANAIATRWLLGAGASLRHEDLGLKVTASAFNLANVRMMDQILFPLPGRTIFLSLSWDMNFSTQPPNS